MLSPEMGPNPFDGLKQILPKLAQPFWYQLVGFTYHDQEKELSKEGLKIKRRKARKADKRRKAGVGYQALLEAVKAA